jgi:hypothetical protein
MKSAIYNVEDRKAFDWLFRFPYSPVSVDRFYHKTIHADADGTAITTDGNWMRIMQEGMPKGFIDSDWEVYKGYKIKKKLSDSFWHFPLVYRTLMNLDCKQVATNVARERVPYILYRSDLFVPIDILYWLEEDVYDIHTKDGFIFLLQGEAGEKTTILTASQ